MISPVQLLRRGMLAGRRGAIPELESGCGTYSPLVAGVEGHRANRKYHVSKKKKGPTPHSAVVHFIQPSNRQPTTLAFPTLHNNRRHTMPGDPPPDDDEYASSEDSDFLPENDAAAAPESDDFDSDVEPEKQKTLPAKRAREDDAAGEGEGSGLDNSGDEALIDKAKKKQKKKKKRRRKDGEDGDEAEGGEGGLVMTRSMRAAE